uniref:HDC11254 n=1 Tax=Drosophila melanogaster TaxID=7227 RepID=Q6IKW3_DROME|nr:TPA_inf: HDC11254 [Drosophila melanogaster]
MADDLVAVSLGHSRMINARHLMSNCREFSGTQDRDIGESRRTGHKTCKWPCQFIAAATAATPQQERQQLLLQQSRSKRSETSSSLWPGGEPVRAIDEEIEGTGQKSEVLESSNVHYPKTCP